MFLLFITQCKVEQVWKQMLTREKWKNVRLKGSSTQELFFKDHRQDTRVGSSNVRPALLSTNLSFFARL